ncbi:MAG TPA: asparagine synthase (glutamine-hydrolyzing) [Bryobacteraceae bacterium]|nr:asparagine synthase (glutamine-hydrolyzing) [Bryobacteraceae bacterium]
MCGIAGFVTARPNAGSSAILRRMTDAIHHRGPDADGYYADAHAFLGHRRLSIVDLATGQQPMSPEQDSHVIIYNGEVFNHADLRPELEKAGHRYHSRSDTETILHAYEQYGRACMERFRGMFSFAIWEPAARRLFCARDRLGIKPFYYFFDGRLFAFASEIKALFEHPEIAPRLDEQGLAEYLAFGYRSTEGTMFAGIRKLMPGHWLTLDASDGFNIEIGQYWDVPQAPQHDEHRDDRSWIEECRSRLEETVRMRLMSDVPLGMFLSGGVDSSAIAALMSKMVDGPVQTFAVGYRERQFSELAFARDAATVFKTQHHEITIGREEFFEALPNLVWHEDEPIAWPSSVSLYFVSRLASERVKVVLTGEGSDELFAGYSRYRHFLRDERWSPVWSAVPEALRRGIRSAIASSGLLSSSLRRKLQHTILGRELGVESLYLDNFYGGFGGEEMHALFPRVSGTSQRYASFLDYWNQRSSDPLLARMLYADQKTYLLELLMKQDQMSMACSIESRVPFLDHPFVEFASRVPAHLKIRNGVGKYIVKQAVRDLVPAALLDRRKMGFPTPLGPWLLDPSTQPLLDSLRDRDGLLASFTDLNRIDALIARHRAGQEDATDRLWRLLNLQIWGDLFLTGRRDRWLKVPSLAAQ